jgi:hypothetical protein
VPLGGLGRRLLLALCAATTAFAVTVIPTGPAYFEPTELALQPVADYTALEPPPVAPVARPPRQQPESSFERILRPFQHESHKARSARALEDPTFWSRVDRRLNSTRLNFLLFGYGETHEPPLTERAFIGSITIFSYDYRSKSIDLISLTHDIRAPEVERHLKEKGQQQVGPIKIDRAYGFGGFPLMRKTLEDATGLAIDFQVAFREDAIAGATDRVFGGLEIDVPLDFRVNAFYMDGEKLPPSEFKAGRQKLDGVRVVGFIKTVPVEENYDKRLEHNARKHLVFRALMDSLRAQVGDPVFLGKAAVFFGTEMAGNSISHDFDIRGLLIENLWQLISDRRDSSERSDAAVPSIARTLYVVDPASGDGGVQWLRANAVTNPATRRDLEANLYPELAMEVPYNGDPQAPDLVTSYWRDVRELIARRLGS